MGGAWNPVRQAAAAVLALVALPSLGCAYRLAQAALPPERPLPEAEVQPHPSETEGDPLKIILGIDLPEGFRDDLEVRNELLGQVLTTMERVGVDASMNTEDYAAIYRDVIRLAERSSNEQYAGRRKVDYVVRGTLTESTLAQTYSDPLWPFGGDDRPGTCEMEAGISLSLEAITLPRVRRSKKWVLTSSDSESYDAPGYCHSHDRPGRPLQTLEEARRNAVGDITDCLEKPLEKYFSPRAYILGYYSDGKNHFFEISGGSAAGFDPGDDVVIERMLPGHKGGGASPVAEAEVTTLVRPKRAYIRVTDAEKVEKIERGHRVRVTVSNPGGALCAFTIEEH